MAVTPGSASKLNNLNGFVRQLNLTSEQMTTTYGTKVFPADVFVVSEKKVYLTDGVTALNALTPIIDTTIAPLTEVQRKALNTTFADGTYKPAEGGFVVLGTAGVDGQAKIADAQLNLVDTSGHLVATYLREVLTDENGVIKLDKLPDQMRRHLVFVDNYAAIAGLTPSQKLDLIFVTDASDDPTGKVESGWAMYAFNVEDGVATGEPIKISEGEGFDIDLDAIASTYENVQKAGAVMYDHPLQVQAPDIDTLMSLLGDAEEEPEEPEELATTLNTKPDNYTGVAGTEVASGLVFGGTETGNIVVTLTGTNCQLKDGESPAQPSVTKTDTITNVNAWLQNVKVVIGEQDGSVAVNCDKIVGDTTITVDMTE